MTPALFAGLFLIMTNFSPLQAWGYEVEIENCYSSAGLATSVFDNSNIAPSDNFLNQRLASYSPYEEEPSGNDSDRSRLMRAGGKEGGGDPTKVTAPIGNGLLFLILLAGIYFFVLSGKRLKIKNQNR